jgi:hypothetical protein
VVPWPSLIAKCAHVASPHIEPFGMMAPEPLCHSSISARIRFTCADHPLVDNHGQFSCCPSSSWAGGRSGSARRATAFSGTCPG